MSRKINWSHIIQRHKLRVYEKKNDVYTLRLAIGDAVAAWYLLNVVVGDLFTDIFISQKLDWKEGTFLNFREGSIPSAICCKKEITISSKKRTNN